MSAAEKLETVQTADLVVINSTPAAIAFNYEETRAWLENELKQYDLVVTADTLASSKKLATELNKLAADISKRRREAVAAVSGPIKTFEDQAKSLEKLCKEGRQKLLDQAQVFEDEERAKAKAALETARAEMWHEQQVVEEFRRTQIDDLVNLTTLTKTGKLSAKAKSELVARISADRNLQQQTQIRLQLLENDSYRAGLAAPLTRAHVETFLFVSDEEYGQRLQVMIVSEIERQKVAEERARQRMEAEQRRAEEESQRKADAERRREEAEQRRQAEAEQQSQQQTVQQHEPVPAQQYEQEPVYRTKTPVPVAPAQTTQKHAYGPLSNAGVATIAECSQSEAEAQAVQLSANAMNEPFGIWVPGKLIAIAFGGEVFRKAG